MDVPWQQKTLKYSVNAYTGGDPSKPAVILLPGWPQTAYAFAEVFPLLSKSHHVFAIDPPGLGLSAAPVDGYDCGNIARLTRDATVHELGAGKKYHLVGHDVGAWISYAWAREYAQDLLSLTLLDGAILGLAASGLSWPLPPEANLKLWQFSFNQLPDLPEMLTRGKERELFDWLFDRKAVHPERITEEKRAHYAETYAREGRMKSGFEFYRAAGVSAKQNASSKEEGKLGIPVLALGGEQGVGAMLKKGMEAVVEGDVKGGVLRDCGHYVMEEQPEEVARWLVGFWR